MTPVPPPVLDRRLVRIGAEVARWSGDPQDLVALGGVGFDIVGDVMGAVAAVLSTEQTGLCGYRGGRASVRLGGELRGQNVLSYPKRAQAAYTLALQRIRDETKARQADGVVGVTTHLRHLDGDLTEITITGLAVRARSITRPQQPFLTTCSPTDVALLLASGWVPLDVHVAVQVGVRHDEDFVETVALVRLDGDARRSNFEVPGFTETITKVRASVRTKLADQFRSAGADGGVVTSITTASHQASCTQLLSRTDRVVRATGWASSFAQADRIGGPTPTPTQELV